MRRHSVAEDRSPLLQGIEDLLAAVLSIPRVWMFFLGLATLASTIRVDRDARGSYGVEFRITWVSALLVALVWLPALLRVISLVGGDLKTPVGEASTAGMARLLDRITPPAKQAALPTMIAALDTVDTGDEPGVEELRRLFESELEDESPREPQKALDALAEDYERLRLTLPPGDERTFFMTRIVAEARSAAHALHLPEMEARRYFEEDSQGNRVVALSIVQSRPAAVLFDVALQAIEQSKSAFEQFHGLRALDAMLPQLARMQRQKAKEVLERQRGPGGWITPEDPSRWEYSAHLLEELADWDRKA